MELTKLFLLYIFIILVIYFIKPGIFQTGNIDPNLLPPGQTIDNIKRRKFILMLLFMMIIAIIIFYLKIFYEYYF